MRPTVPEDLDRRELILELASRLARHPAVERVWLFGSRARGDHFERSDTIQRFEFTFELFWKALRRLLAGQGIAANSPKAVLQQAYRLGWLDDEPRWLQVLEDRNLSSHSYPEPLALEIYGRIPANHAAMRAAVQKLRASA